VSLLVDTSVWSLAFRRDGQPGVPEVAALRGALLGAEQVFTTGLVLQEVLQGFAGPRNRDQLVERLSVLAFLQPDKLDHIAAADIRNACRRRGVQIGTIDADNRSGLPCGLSARGCPVMDPGLSVLLAGIAAEAEGRQVAEVVGYALVAEQCEATANHRGLLRFFKRRALGRAAAVPARCPGSVSVARAQGNTLSARAFRRRSLLIRLAASGRARAR